MKSNSEKLRELAAKIMSDADNISPTKRIYPTDEMVKWARSLRAIALDLERKDEANVGYIDVLHEDGEIVAKFTAAPGKDLRNDPRVKKLMGKS